MERAGGRERRGGEGECLAGIFQDGEKKEPSPSNLNFILGLLTPRRASASPSAALNPAAAAAALSTQQQDI